VRRTGAALALLSLGAFAAATVATHRRESEEAARHARGVAGTGPDGFAGLWQWAETTGRAPLRIGSDAEVPKGAVWILAAPRARLGAADAGAFLDHARAGSLAVWALGPEPQPELEARLAFRRDPLHARLAATAGPLVPHPLFRGLALRSRCEPMESGVPGAVALAGDRPCTIALSVPVGSGEVLVLAGDDLLANRAIGSADHLALWARAAGRGVLAFDERWLAGRPPRGLPANLALLLAQAAFATLLFGWAVLPRLGAVRVPEALSSASGPAGYLRSLAALYRRARAEPQLVRAALESLRERLRQRAGIPRTLSDVEAVRALAARSPEASQAFAEAASAERGATAGTADLLRVTRAAFDVEAALDAVKRRG
jgi:hypothetical protein